MILHVLPGDALAERFSVAQIRGDTIVCRECLIDGEVEAESLSEFWRTRECFLESAYPEAKGTYAEQVAEELGKLIDLPPGTEVNLWFEYELFCQVNMWFCLHLLRNTRATVYRVAPSVLETDEVWNGFGELTVGDLLKCFADRKQFGTEEIKLGAQLWATYARRDYTLLRALAERRSSCLPFLREVCEAEIEKARRPRQVLSEIESTGVRDFKEIFREFDKRAGVYGFGDAQVKRLLKTT